LFYSCYPDDPPITPLEKLIDRLNNEAFPSEQLARVDDLIVYALYASKRHPNNPLAFQSSTVLECDNTKQLPTGHEDGIALCHLYHEYVNERETVQPEKIAKLTDAICKRFPTLFCDSDVPVLYQ
jgi:hypothetical protein